MSIFLKKHNPLNGVKKTVVPGSPRTFSVPEGYMLVVSSTKGSSGLGSVSRLGSLDSWNVGSVTKECGPFSGSQKLLVTCTGGSIDARVVDSVLGALQVSTDAGTGVSTLSAKSRRLAVASDHTKPIVVIGNDHNYLQQYGTNGKNGATAMFLDQGLRNYIAVNNPGVSFAPGAGYGSTENPGMSWAQLAELSAAGAEVVAHGYRHPSNWQRISTGILIQYGRGLGKGGAAAPTVAVSTTGVTLTGNGGAENVTLTFATYPTIAQLVAAIAATPGWWSQAAPELDGTEASNNILPLMAPRNIKATNNAYTRTTPMGQYFAASGGLMVWNQSGADDVFFSVKGTLIQVFINGVYAVGADLTTLTLSQLKTLIDSSPIGVNLVCNLLDNGGTNTRENYLQGDEAASCLNKISQVRGQGVPGYLEAGLSHQYVVRKNLSRCADVGAANGVPIKHFAASGAYFEPHVMRDLEKIDTVRGGGWGVIYPNARPISWGHNHFWSQVTFDLANYGTLARKKAVIDALAASGPWMVDILIHSLIVDGTSPYPLLPANSEDQTESQMHQFLCQSLGPANRSGAVRNMAPSEAASVRHLAPMPKNMFFNAGLINSGESLLGNNGDTGYIVPGWLTRTSVAGVPAITALNVSNGRLAYTGNGAQIDLLRQDVFMEPGAVHEIGFELEILSNTGGGVNLGYNPMSYFAALTGGTPATSVYNRHGPLYSGVGKYSVRLLVQCPTSDVNHLPTVISQNVGPYNLSTNNTININIDLKGAIDVNCAAGAISASAVTAKEVAVAINAAIAASPLYPAEYHNCVSAVNNRVVIKGPYAYLGTEADQQILVAGGPAGSAPRLIFGGFNGTVQATGRLGSAGAETYLNSVKLTTSINGSAIVGGFYCRRVDNRS